MSRADIAASDARIEYIRVLEEDINKMLSGEKPVEVTAGEELIRLYEEEKFDLYMGQAYTRAALLHSMMGDEEGTQVLARKAADAMELEFGEDHEDTRAMKVLVEDRETHWSWDIVRKFEEGM